MISPVSLSASGIKAAFDSIDVSANNVANANTDGFKSDTAAFSEGANGGVVVNIRKSNTPGPAYFKDGKTAVASNTDLVQETAAEISAKTMASANIAVLKTADEMEKKAIDILA